MDRTRDTTAIIAYLLFLFIRAEAQHQDASSSGEHELNHLRPSMAVVLTVLAIMFCLTFLIVAYAKFCQTIPDASPQGLVRIRSRFSGIDRTAIESLPFFKFSSLKGAKDGLECAVCLSRFEETEVLRLLPKCRHAFHIGCIDKWLEIHSSCPLCRYRITAGDVKSLSFGTTSFRLPRVSGDDLEFFIHREENQSQRRSSSRFNLLNWGNREEPLIRETDHEGKAGKILHSIKHKIIVSDVILKSRWSDVNSSDMMSLSSEMLKEMAEAKGGGSAREQMMKIKEDMERKRVYENVSRKGNLPGECSGWKDDEVDGSMAGKSVEKRSMSEITNLPRFTGSRRYSSAEKDEEVRRVWLPIARRTIQWFSGRETGSDPEERKHSVNV